MMLTLGNDTEDHVLISIASHHFSKFMIMGSPINYMDGPTILSSFKLLTTLKQPDHRKDQSISLKSVPLNLPCRITALTLLCKSSVQQEVMNILTTSLVQQPAKNWPLLVDYQALYFLQAVILIFMSIAITGSPCPD